MPTGVPLSPIERAAREVEANVNKLVKAARSLGEERRDLAAQMDSLQNALAPKKRRNGTAPTAEQDGQ